MKKALIVIIILGLFLSLNSIVFADNQFSIKHSAITKNDGLSDIKVATPYFEGFNGSDKLNQYIRSTVIDAIGNVNAMGIQLQEFPHTPVLNIYYDYSNIGDILSLQLTTYSYLGGAHGSTVIDSITINASTGQIYSFKDIFQNELEGAKLVEEFILDSISKDPEPYFENYKETIANKHGDFDFYFYGDSLIIYFGQYEIAPYAAGIRYFEVNKNDLERLLKEEIFASLKKGYKRGDLSYNGIDVGGAQKVKYADDMAMVPLRSIAEALGYEVGWNEKDGAIIEGGFIKNGINSYWKATKEPVRLTAPMVIDGITYVPINYFTEVLGENVIFESHDNELVVRAFGKDGFENNFDRLIENFSFPLSAEEAVNMYAEAVKTRNGAMQYGLLSDELRETEYGQFNELAFVTGVSSPWVDSYEITKMDNGLYQIEFTLKTSAPDDLIKETTIIAVNKDNDYWRIFKMHE